MFWFAKAWAFFNYKKKREIYFIPTCKKKQTKKKIAFGSFKATVIGALRLSDSRSC